MAVTDPIADLLTRIRNASVAYHDTVEVSSSKLKSEIVRVLHEEGYIRDFKLTEDDKQGMISINLKYAGRKGKERAITNLKRISKPGLRVYAPHSKVPKVLGGLGIAILTTSKGVLTDSQARELGVGGEVLCYVW